MRDPSVTRDRVAGRFARAFSERSAVLGVGSDIDFAVMGKQLEICTWNWIIRTAEKGFPLTWESHIYRHRYTQKAVSLEHNIRSNVCEALMTRILSREVGLKAFVTMKPWEMAPDHWEKSFERVARIQMQKIVPLQAIDDTVEGLLQCGKCKSKKTTYSSMQTRSADEPMTVFALCLACGNRWKQN